MAGEYVHRFGFKSGGNGIVIGRLLDKETAAARQELLDGIREGAGFLSLDALQRVLVAVKSEEKMFPSGTNTGPKSDSETSVEEESEV